jgi:hypothetical protein
MSMTRRRVLAALAVAGGAGALTGSGTAAMLADSERSGGSLTTGVVDLVVEYELLTGPGAGTVTTVDGPRLRVPIDGLGYESAAGSMLVTFALPQTRNDPNNPAALWLASQCPTPGATTLGETLTLTLSYADCATGEPIRPIIQGRLREVADQLQAGYRIDGAPLTPGDDCLTDEVCLLLEYDLDGYVGSEHLDLAFWFRAIQCRHAESQANPFAGRDIQPCEPGELCRGCRTLGKLEFEANTQPGLADSYAAPGTYAFTEGSTEYGLEIYDTTEKSNGAETTGVAFRLVDLDDPNGVVPAIYKVYVKGGPGYLAYDRTGGAPTDTTELSGAVDGIVAAPDRKGISHVTVCICTPDPTCVCDDPSLDPGNGNNNPNGGPRSPGANGGSTEETS